MPKQKITKEMIVEAAFELARKGGMEQVLVKNIAGKLGCSVQPIYSYCQNMDGLRSDVERRARQFLQEYMAAHIDQEDAFRSTGHAWLQLAREEPNILKIFVFQKRTGISSLDDLYRAEASPDLAEKIAADLSVSIKIAKQLHLHMLIYTIGLGTVFSVTTPGIPADEIYAQQELACQTFLKYALEEMKETENMIPPERSRS